MKSVKPSDWKTSPLPLKKATTPLDRTFSAEEMELIRLGFAPESMDDKWFIYWTDNKLFFHRSWTGRCCYVVKFVEDHDSFRMFEADVNSDPKKYGQGHALHDAQLISRLIDLFLLQRGSDFLK